MPLISERIAMTEDADSSTVNSTLASIPTAPAGSGPVNALSPTGNPAPNRGLFPVENMYDFQIQQFYPDTPYFVRGNVNVNIFGDNLALLAYAKAGGKIV